MNLRAHAAAKTAAQTAATTAALAAALLGASAAAVPVPATAASSKATAVRQVDPAKCEKNIDKNHTYQAHGYTFRTDGQGRPEHADAFNMKVTKAGRGSCATKVGQMGGSGYDGVHLITNSLNGDDKRYNLVPQNHALNTGSYNHQVEGGTRRCITNGGQIPAT